VIDGFARASTGIGVRLGPPRAPLACSEDSNVPEHPKQADLESLLNALKGAGIEFIVVGGAAAGLHGARD